MGTMLPVHTRAHITPPHDYCPAPYPTTCNLGAYVQCYTMDTMIHFDTKPPIIVMHTLDDLRTC